MLQPSGDSNVPLHHQVAQPQVDDIPVKTRLPQSDIQVIPQNNLQQRYEQQQLLYEQINNNAKLNKEPSVASLDQSMLQTTIYAVPNRPYSKEPQILSCIHCNRPVMTDVQLKAGWGSCLCAFLLCLTPLLFFFFLPCCMRACKDAHHYCRRCGHKMGQYNFICD